MAVCLRIVTLGNSYFANTWPRRPADCMPGMNLDPSCAILRAAAPGTGRSLNMRILLAVNRNNSVRSV